MLLETRNHKKKIEPQRRKGHEALELFKLRTSKNVFERPQKLSYPFFGRRIPVDFSGGFHKLLAGHDRESATVSKTWWKQVPRGYTSGSNQDPPRREVPTPRHRAGVDHGHSQAGSALCFPRITRIEGRNPGHGPVFYAYLAYIHPISPGRDEEGGVGLGGRGCAVEASETLNESVEVQSLRTPFPDPLKDRPSFIPR